MYFTSVLDSGPGYGRKDFRRIANRAAFAAAVLLCLAAFTGVAKAGTYDVWSCSTAGDAPVGTTAWELESHYAAEGLTASDSCSSGGSLELALAPGTHTHAFGAYKFNAPAGTSIVGYQLRRSLETAASPAPHQFRFEAFVRERVNLLQSADYGCASFGAGCVAAGNPNDAFDPANVAIQHAANLQSIELWVDCGWEWCGAPAGIGARIRLFRSQVTLSDPIAPTVLATSGTMLDAPATGVATLRVGATDFGGGIASASVSIDGGPAKNWSAGDSFASCNLPYSAPRPCPLETDASFAIDTTGYANGAHVLQGNVTDAAGNVTPFGPIAIAIQNTATPPPEPPVVIAQAAGNGSPAVQTPLLTLNAGSMIRARGTKTAVTGMLKTQSGAPIAGATLSVNSVELATDELKEQALPDITTAADGSFSVLIDHDGAQLLRVAFAPSPGAANTATASVAVRTRTDITLKPSKSKLKRGRSVTLKGKLLGAGSAAHGSTVSIQAIVHGKWRPVGAATVRRDGSFQWSYRFVAVTRTTNFSFRAVIVKTPGWPWPTIASDSRRVKVTA